MKEEINRHIENNHSRIFNSSSNLVEDVKLTFLKKNGYLKIENNNNYDFQNITQYFEKIREIDDNKFYYFNFKKVLKYSIALNQLLIDKFFMNSELFKICKLYLNSQPMLNYIMIGRTFTKKNPNTSSGQWHIDGGGNFLKLMILLSDVDENSIHTRYLNNTHKIFFKDKFFSNTRFDNNKLEYFLKKYQISRFTGKKGDMYLFDPNGIHSGSYGENNFRDSIIIQIGSEFIFKYLQQFGFLFDKFKITTSKKTFNLIKKSSFLKTHTIKKSFFKKDVDIGNREFPINENFVLI